MEGVTPEMLEKARQFYAQDVGVGAANYATEVGRLEGQVSYRIELMARFAASAVQDAVSAACQIMTKEIEHWDYSDLPAEDAVEIALDNVASALREKYGVKR